MGRQRDGGHGAHGVDPGGQDAHRGCREAAVVLADVAIAAARVLDDPRQRQRPGRELLVVDRDGGGDVERVPALLRQALLEVDLLAVDEEARVHPAGRGGRLAPHRERARLPPVDLSHARAGALHADPPRQPERCGQRRRHGRKAPGRGLRRSVGAPQRRDRAGRPAVALERARQRRRRPRQELGVLVQEQAVAPSRALHQLAVVERLAAPLAQGDQLDLLAARADGGGRAVVGAVVEHQHLAGDRELLALRTDGVEAAHQQLAPAGVDHAEGDIDAHPAYCRAP